MKINKEQIKELKPCEDGYEWYLKNGTEDLLETLLKINEYKPEWSSWLFSRLMNKTQRVKISVFSAELVLHIFENKYPDDKRPRLAIEAAKKYLENPGLSTTIDSANAAAYAADAAVYVVDAVDAAANAAYYAAFAAAYAADAAAYSANAAAANAAFAATPSERKKIQELIIKEAVRILEE